jgi:hypothetical protein
VKAKDNPFSTDRLLTLRYRPLGKPWDVLMRDLAALRYRAAIVGPEGSGKTTLLEDLGPRLREHGLFPSYFCAPQAAAVSIPPGITAFFRHLRERDVALIDSAERLSSLQWAICRFCARGIGGLIITSHTEGRLPTLINCATTPALLRTLLHELLGDDARQLEGRVKRVFDKHEGNIRNALFEYYDLFAGEKPITLC